MADVNILIDIVLLAFLVATGIAILHLRHLFAVVMLAGIYSLLSAAFFVVMDAVDVSFTEASVGAGISTVLMLAAIALTRREEKPVKTHAQWLPLLVVTVTGGLLIYGISDIPAFGDPDAPIHQHVAPRYIEQSPEEIGVPNMVTSVLASYRGYDTLGETVVIFTAGVSVMLLLGLGGFRKRKREEQDT